MQYVIVELKDNPPMIGSVTGPFPNAAAAISVAVSMGGVVTGYYVRPIHEPGERS